MNILLGVTGSVAAIKTPELAGSLSKVGEVKLVSTKTAFYFFDKKEIEVPIITDEDEWGSGYERGQSIPHIELGKWADVLVIAPLSADTLAKLAHGRCDNLLTCIVRAWNMGKPLVIAPAMNTHMWEHPATQEHLSTLKRWHKDKLYVLDPVEKELACGDVGVGGMTSVKDLSTYLKKHLFHQSIDVQ